eukprot:gene271-306_t
MITSGITSAPLVMPEVIIGLSLLLARSITQPLRQAEAMAQSIADMDLTDAPQAQYNGDEMGRLLRILDHDGWGDNEGGIEAWSRLGEAVGIPRAELWSLQQVLPGVRFAVDAYVNFARQSTWQEGVCSSLTEMFAPRIHKDRLASWPRNYPWIDPDGLHYFRSRISLAERDVEHGLQVTLAHFATRQQQERALEILQFKLDVLWSMMDAIDRAYG